MEIRMQQRTMSADSYLASPQCTILDNEHQFTRKQLFSDSMCNVSNLSNFRANTDNADLTSLSSLTLQMLNQANISCPYNNINKNTTLNSKDRVALRRAALLTPMAHQLNSRLRLNLSQALTVPNTQHSLDFDDSLSLSTSSLTCSDTGNYSTCSSESESFDDEQTLSTPPPNHTSYWPDDKVESFVWNVDAAPWVPSVSLTETTITQAMPDIGDLSLQSTLQSEQDNTAQIKPKRTRRAGRRRQRQRNDKCNNLNESSIIQLAKQHCTSQSVTCNLPFGYSSPREINYSFKPELNAVSTRFMQPNLQQHQNKDDRLTKFSIMSWNVLSEQYANRPRFDYVAPSLLDWKARSAHILHTIMSSNADIIALQEVDESFYNNVLLPTLNEYNYKGVYERKRHHNLTDGCAILYREERFKLGSISVIHYQESNLKETIENIDNAANPSTTSKSNSTQQRDLACRFNMHHNLAIIAKFCDQRTGRHLRVVNTHLLADPTYSDAKLLQVALLCEKLEQQDQYDLKNGLSNSQPTPTVLCGDWNSLPDSDVMAYLLRGRIGRQAFGGNNFGRFTRSRTLRHRLQLACAYAAAGAKISATVRTPQFTGEIDRILYTSSESLRVVSTLGDINQQHRRIFFPNEEIPSDHIPLLAIFTDTPTESSPQVNGDIDTALIEISHTLSKDISKLTSSMPKTLILPMRQKDIPTTMPCYATNQVANSSIGMPMMSTAHPLSTDYFIKLSDIKGILKEESRSPRRYRGSRGKRGGKRAARANAKGKDTTKSQKKTNNNSESLVTAV